MESVFLLLLLSNAYIALAVNKVKIMDNPLNYRARNINSPSLTTLVAPNDFIGPSHFRELIGQCYEQNTGVFRFSLCPFNNVTQHETTYRVGAFNGVVGVWTDWLVELPSITDSTGHTRLVGWRFNDGDSCQVEQSSRTKLRSMLVRLVCKTDDEEDHAATKRVSNHRLTDVVEPSPCEYEANFITTLACAPNVVYALLNVTQKHRYDEYWTELKNSEISSQLFEAQVRKLLSEATLLVDDSQKAEVVEQPLQTLDTNQVLKGNCSCADLEHYVEQLEVLVTQLGGVANLSSVRANSNVLRKSGTLKLPRN